MRQYLIVFLIALSGSFAKDCSKLRRNSNSKLFCYYSKLTDIDGCFCTHVILPANSDVKSVERVRQHVGDPKILITVNEFNQGLLKLLKNTKVDGLELNLKKLDSKNDITDFISTVRSKLGSDLYLAVSIPAKSEILAKYYDFKALSKHADLFILQTAFLGASSNVTFHPSRLSGIWDMQNTDSIVDLVNGLGAPLSKVIISAPVQAYDFTLQNEQYSAVGSPATELRSISRDELCRQMNKKANWTLERDQDQAAPYIFNGKKWIAFEDTTSIDIKAKYSRIRGLAGLALKDVSQDGGLNCGVSLLETAYNGLSRQARAPRQAILHSLEREILETPQTALGGIHVSPFRISRVIDVEGKWHVIRQDTRTEFSCTRQGYFVHPRSCNRFYRCVKFDQLVDDYSVFEFDCPAGLAFDERVEVCVWPGSIPEGQACAGSSEIAPVPKERFNCPHEPGYYADPENCRWFFACLDHGRSALTAYEFRCPFGLVFDSDRLMCEWSWLVPKCVAGTRINVASEYYYGGYSGSGNYQTANVLQTYDGLGALGLVKLDGVRGEIQQPIINSNVGIYGYQGIGGLGQQATQSLYKSGLIKTNIGVPHTIIGTENINVIDSGAYNNARVNAYAVTNEGVANSLGEGSSENRYLSGVNSVGAGLISNINLNANAAKATLANTYSTVQHSGAANLNYGSAFGAKSLNAVATNLGAYQNHQYVENNNEAQAQVSSSQNLYQNSDIGSVVIANQAINAFESSSGALYNNQFAANTQAVKNTGISGSVDIVGGGYSAVGEVNTGVHTSNVHIAQPNAYSVVPTVTSVPIPSLNEGKGFEVHQGSVIANVPELQLRIQNSVPSVSSVVHSGNYVRGSTPRPIIQEQQPIIAVDENSQTANGGANSFTYHTQDYSKTGGYIYDKPSVAFVEGNQELINKNNNIGLSVSTIRPNVIVQQAVTPVVDIQQSNQYIYSQQHAAIPKVTVSVPSSPVTIQPHISESYSYSTTSNPVSFIQQQPQRITPVIQAQIPQVNVQPQVILEQSQVSVSSTPRPLGESYSTHLESTYSEGYQYPQPAVQLTAEPIRPVQPKIISSYSIKQPVNPLINTQLDIGQKQVRVESPLYINHINNVKGVSLSPVTYTTARPNTVIHNEVSVQPVSIGYQEVAKVNVAPAVVTQYHIQKPSVTRYSYKDSLLNIRPIKPAVVPVISSTPQPINVNYFSANQEQNTAFAGYSYPKPETVFIEEPKSVIQQPVQEVPFVKETAYITGHSNQNFNEQGNYNYINNIVSSTPATPVVPVVVENYQAPIDYKKTFVFGSTPKPTYISTVSSIISKNEVPQEFYFYDSRLSTSKPTIIEERPAVPIISVSSTPKPRVRYSYLKPTIVSSTENYIPVQTVTTSRPITKYSFSSVLNEYNSKPIISTPDTFVSSYSSNTNTGPGYSYPKPAVVFEEKPAVPVRYVSSTETYVPVQTVTTSRPIIKYSFSSLQSQYQSKPIIPTPDAFVSSYSSIPNNEPGYSYSKPAVVFEEKPAVPVRYVSSTETYVPVQTVTTSRPIAKYSFSSLDGQYAPKPIVVSTPAPFVSTYSSAIRARPGKLGIVENFQAPIVLDSVQRNEFQEVNSYSNIVQSTPKPTFISTISSVRPKVTVTSTESPFYYYDSRLTTPSGNLQNEYLPTEVVSTTLRPTEAYSLSTLEDYSITPTFRTSPPRTRIRVTTSQPEAVYVRQRSRIRYTSTTEPSISTYPSNEYLPVEKLSTISLPVAVTTPSREYLPIRSRVTTEAIPVDDEVEISTRRLANIVSGKTIIKQNDFLPMLSAKLGAQCTCTSNKLNVRKKQKIIVVEDEEDDDGYVVENNDNNGIVVENYEYEPQKVIDITPTPQVYIKSSSSEPILTSTYRIRSRQRGRPKIEAYEEEDDRPSDREIVKAVKTGLKLVKQAAKEGAKEGTEEALQENNLRVRDKIDCQRAGLFRHPTQCNKFYSCKWDCTKNKYVVHSFNCPIHLTFDSSLGACNWPSQGPACAENTLLTIQ